MSSMQPLECPYCGYYIRNVYAPMHQLISLSNTICTKCYKTFSWEGDLGRVVTYTEPLLEDAVMLFLECPYCGKRSKWPYAVPLHDTELHPARKCGRCGKTYNWKGENGKIVIY